MDSDTSSHARTPRRHTIAPAGRQFAPSNPGASTTAYTQHAPPSPTSSGTSPASPSLTSASNRSSALYESAEPTTDRQQKRLSLNFPIQPPNGRPRPQSWLGAATLRSADLLQPQPSPTSGDFFTALAAQERRVLELKEELHKAELQLVSLKKQWALREVARKRSDARNRIETLQPINTSLSVQQSPTDDSEDGQSSMHKEMERRKALLSAPRQPSRKVISGSRHTRQLSLLSPDKSYAPSFPQPPDVRGSEDVVAKTQRISRSATTNDTHDRANRIENDFDMRTMQGEDILRTGKKMATDFKDGLWTFIEDLRQATVGEEGVSGQPARTQSSRPLRQSSKNNLKAAKAASQNRPQGLAPKANANGDLIDIGGSFWKEHGVDEKNASGTNKASKQLRSAKTPQKPVRQAVDDQGESWDTWDTPTDRSSQPFSASESISDGRTTPNSARSTPRTSTSSTADVATVSTPGHSRNESIPWPALEKLSPTNLRRTASHLMREWEKSLTPPAEAREHTASGDYIGRDVSPAREASSKAD